MTASTANSQALKFRICSTDEENERVFGTLKWAGALPDWDGPVKGERPSAYLIILCDLALGKNKLQDNGITAQTIMLGAVEMGYGGCMLGNVERKRLAELLDVYKRQHLQEGIAMIRLVLPTEDYEEQVLDYKASFERDGDSLDGIAGLLNFRTFKEWYEALLDNSCEATVRRCV